MNKTELLELEANAHLSINELRKSKPKLAKPLDERLETRVHRNVVAQLAGGSERLRKLVEGIKVPIDKDPEKLKLRDVTLKALREAAKADKQLAGDAEFEKELDEVEKAAATPGPGAKPDITLADSLRLDEPIAFHPEFRKELDAAKLFRLSDALGLGDKTAELLIKEVGRPIDITEGRLKTLLKDKKLTAKEAEAAGLAASLYNILDERPELVAAAKPIRAARELVKLDKGAWTKLITDSKTKTPGGVAPDAYAELLERKVKRLFPTDALSNRLGNVKVADAIKRNGELNSLRKLNPGRKLIGKQDFDALKTDGLAAAEVKKLRAAFDETVQLANRFWGMKIANVLDDTSLSDADRETEVKRRVDLVDKFFADNQDVLRADLAPGSNETKTLNFAAGASEPDKAMVLATARAYQRALTVTDDVTDAEALVGGGYPSALAVAMSRPKKIAARTALKEEVAALYYDKAKRVATAVTAHAGTIIDVLGGMFGDIAVGNISTEIGGYLKEIPGFADFFGNQSFCNCKHCQSILGPAAYFVDLMSFVDEKVTQEFFAAKPDHPLNLKKRRPDLWNLELTCENTNTPIPYLVVINEILENAVAQHAGFVGDFGNRVAVATKVYQDTLPDKVDSFLQPLNLPFEELRIYVQHFQRSLADMAEAGNATGDALARLRLRLPPKDFELISSQTNDGMPFLRRIYGIQFTEAGGAINKFDAQLLLKPMGVSRHELGELIATRYVTAKGAVNIRITGEKRNAQSVQNDIENISGLTRSALDRIHRFVRLWRATGWRIGELDLVLTHVEQGGIGGSLDAATVRAVATVYRLQNTRELSVEDTVALWSTVPSHPVLRSLPPPPGGVDDAPSIYPAPASPLGRLTVPLFDRVFNQKSFVDADGTYPKPGTTFLHPALAAVPPAAADPNLHRLLAGTGTTEDELLQLILGLARPLGIHPESNIDAEKSFGLDERNLCLLFRHARLAKLIKRTPPELFALAAMAPGLVNAHVEGLPDLDALLKFDAWAASTDWTVAELVRMIRPALPAVVTSSATVAGTAGGAAVTFTATLDGVIQPAETVTFAANADLDSVIADWNGQAQHAVAYRSDARGVERRSGDRLSIRSKDTGPHAKIEVTADSLPVFAAAPPLTVTGRELVPALQRPELPDARELAEALVNQIAEADSLVFADTVFALMPPTSPVATSAGPVANTAGTESVTYSVLLAGEARGPETINLAASPDLSAVVQDWNSKATLTQAYRSDAAGNRSDAGSHLSITVKSASGSNTKIIVTASPAPLFAVAEHKGAEITEPQSRELFSTNAALFEISDPEGRYRLKQGFDPAAPLVIPATVDAALGPALLRILGAYHSTGLLPALLPSRLNLNPSALPHLLAMLGVNLGSDAYFRELRGTSAPTAIAKLIVDLRPVSLLLKDLSVFNASRLEFLLQEAALFEISSFRTLPTEAVRSVETFRSLLVPWLTREESPPALESLLRAFLPGTRFATADQLELARLLGCHEGLLQSVATNLAFSTRPFAVLRELKDALAFSQHVGIGGAAFKLAQSTVHSDLATASAALQAAFRTKYQDEVELEKQVEPFRNALLSRRRDGLVAYLVHSGPSRFDEVSDLYHYFLLDIELEGCARTSRVAAAIDSVQLYVHRCLMNLEETAPGDPSPVHVLPQAIPADEWDWRKNYRVWEANRKIFLYPENYIEPELRDDKTPLFKQLEEELLSKEITDEAILEAYARYLRGFDELAHLTIAGSYHEKDAERKRDVLHLCGVTADEPPTFYYRRVENAHYGFNSDEISTHWGPWEKMNVQVPVRKISPLVHRGQLYVFWCRYTTKSKNQISGGTSSFSGYEHTGIVEFSKRKVDGSWTPPQKLTLAEAPFTETSHPAWFTTGGLISDPIVTKSDQLLGFTVTIKILSLYVGTFNADAQGRVLAGPIPNMQLPAELLNAYTVTTVSEGTYELIVTPIRANSVAMPLYDMERHQAPKDSYTLDGFAWERIYPSSDGARISIRGFDFQLHAAVDLYRLRTGDVLWLDTEGVTVRDRGVPWYNPGATAAVAVLIYICTCFKVNLLKDLAPGKLVWSRAEYDRRHLFKMNAGIACFDKYSFASLLLDQANLVPYKKAISSTVWNGPLWDDDVTKYLDDQFTGTSIGDVATDTLLDVVNGSINDVIIQSNRDALYLQGNVRADGKYALRRLNTSLSDDIADLLFGRGLVDLLETKTQLGLQEKPTGLNLLSSEVHDATGVGGIDFEGALGTYLREIFFHIPFLIADHLNSQGRFAHAQSWYHYIFDPTASETIQGIDPTLPEAERRVRELDRNWRYREFRNLTAETLRQQLTNQHAIDQYRRNPFNPHAVARLRLTAYQKTIVMKYVDNLLDWGDEDFVRAFALRNPELLRLATLKYVTAQEILGDRPALLGDCGDGKLSPKNFATIAENATDGSEFLMEVESVVAIRHRLQLASPKDALVQVEADRGFMELERYAHAAALPTGPAASPFRTDATTRAVRRSIAALKLDARETQVNAARLSSADLWALKPRVEPQEVSVSRFEGRAERLDKSWSLGKSLVVQLNPIFCVPGNDRLAAYWDRVEDRLYKLRHCLDIDGVPRQLPLFAPAIDPGLLVAGKAAGMGLDDILAAAGGQLPPYRFRYLIEKAKGYAASVQAFGGALLGALEKRDAEQLARLRNLHQRNILALTTEVKRDELKTAEESVEVTTRRQAAAQYRYDYYDGLISSGLTPAEITQTAARVTATVAQAVQLGLATAAGISYLLPQVGSPFAMKYGGQEVGNSLKTFSAVAGFTRQAAEMVASIAGIVSGFERREQGWEHQKDLADKDLRTIEKELAIAELRKSIAIRGLELHEKTKEQHDEVIDFFEDKFSNLGLYTYLSRTLQQLHREAYNNALAMARLAEQAYRFERPGDNTIFVGGEWDASRSGLLAGERMNLALQRMERRFTETTARSAEINQSFSLTQINPQALIDLKEIGNCEFALPEFFFDMFYPGHYRRRVRAVRLTIPCITGPYTNVSAKLTLLRSYIRRDAVLGAGNLLEVPPFGTATVATSTAQGDAGVFELSFRDERYMPFEGAGAISTWRLELPSHFRPFDYQSINDVILNISYTADEDGTLRQSVESQNAAVAGSLLHFLSNNSLTRVFSLRQEFSSAYNRLAQAAVGTPVTLDINERHFPLFLPRKALTATAADVVLAVTDRTTAVGGFSISINGTPAAAFPAATNPPAPGDPLGGLPRKGINAAFAGGLKKQHSITINNAGGFALAGGGGALDPDKLRDIVLVVHYRL